SLSIMVNPGGFTGRRKQFLADQDALYAAAIREGHVNDTVADIQRRYFKRFPITLPHTEEPTEDFLAAVDDAAPDPELAAPSKDGTEPAAYARAQRVYELQSKELQMRKSQIKRRLHYQFTKSQTKKTTVDVGSTDPMAALMTKLTGTSVQRPRLRTAYNLWGPAHRCFIDPVFQERVRQENVPASRHAALRSSIYKELFDELPQEERQEWSNKAEQEHQAALAKVSHALKTGASTAPEDRQRCVIIETITPFVEPILDLIAEHTGWKVSLMAGGPEPADGGRLNMISVHSGTTSGPVKMNFGRSERVPYKDYFVPIFGAFLRKCYSVQECRASALPEKHDFVGLAGTELHDGVQVDTFDDGRCAEDDDFVRVSKPHASAADPVHPTPAAPSASDASSTPPAYVPSTEKSPSGNSSSGTTSHSQSTTSAEGRGSFALPMSGSAAVPGVDDLAGMVMRKPTRKRSGTATTKTNQKKKQRTAIESTSAAASISTSRAAMDVSAPNGCPSWVTNALELLRSEDFGEEWDSLIVAWLKFEGKSGYQGSAKLGTHHRPRVIADWIQRARSPKYRPEVKNINTLAADFIAWWKGIRRPGINGLLSIVAGLFFWGHAIRDAKPVAKERWLESVNDVSFVIAQLL
ncbi:hypothetical protein HYPSUDRAFT_133378, partial [Hypholoma sublateritium FD-334 SS-4]